MNYNKSPLRIKADKREIKDFPKLPSATSFIRESLYAILPWEMIKRRINNDLL